MRLHLIMLTLLGFACLTLAVPLPGRTGASRELAGPAGPPFTQKLVSRGDPRSGNDFVAVAVIPTTEARTRFDLYRFECHAFVVRKLKIVGTEAPVSVGAREIHSALAATRTETVEPVVCAWKLPARSRGRFLNVVWLWKTHDPYSGGTIGHANAGWRIK